MMVITLGLLNLDEELMCRHDIFFFYITHLHNTIAICILKTSTTWHLSSCGLYVSQQMIRASLEISYSYFFKPAYWLSYTGPQCSCSVLSSFQVLPIPRCRYMMMVVLNVALKQLQHNLLNVFEWILIVIIILLSTHTLYSSVFSQTCIYWMYLI